ncbi:hypothetical protein NIES970_25360 [[Synechococcus] sp. NIES-970]|nr:hypothetical protein NIES970_25360 [[Synechococcus] sp. NIES-970]
MGQGKAVLPDVAQKLTLQEFLRACTTTDLREIPQAEMLALQFLREGTFQERWRLVKIFAKLSDKAIAPLLAIAEDPLADTELRWFAIRILGQYRDPEAIARLILLIDDCSEEFLLEEIMGTLVQLEAQAVDYLVPLLKKPDTRSLAVQALCKLRYPQMIRPLLEIISGVEPLDHCLILETLSQFRQPEILAALVGALKNPVAGVRRMAVKGLGFWAQSVDPLLLCEQVQPLLYDLDLQVCAQAGFTLSRLAIPQAAEAIATVLASPHTPEPLRISLIQALGWLAIPESLDILESLLYGTPPAIVQEAIKVMGRISEPSRRHRGTSILLQFWASCPSPPPASIQQAFVYALGQLADPRAEGLLAALSHSQDKMIQLHAIAALKKINRC